MPKFCVIDISACTVVKKAKIPSSSGEINHTTTKLKIIPIILVEKDSKTPHFTPENNQL